MKITAIRGYDLLTGSVVSLIGALVVWKAATYPVGSASSMGPGYFPLLFGLLMFIFGLAIIFVEGRRPGDAVRIHVQVRAIVFISLGLASFGILIERAGLVPAVMATTILCCFANRKTGPVAAIVLSVVAALLSSAIFVWALRMPMNLVRWG